MTKTFLYDTNKAACCSEVEQHAVFHFLMERESNLVNIHKVHYNASCGLTLIEHQGGFYLDV